MECSALVTLPSSSSGLWESGNPALFAGFPSEVGKSLLDFSTSRLFHSPSRHPFFLLPVTTRSFSPARQADISCANRTFHGSTRRALPLACSRGASCDSPATTVDPLGAWAAFISWPWPPSVLWPALDLGLESPPKPRPDRDSESVIAHPPIRTPYFAIPRHYSKRSELTTGKGHRNAGG